MTEINISLPEILIKEIEVIPKTGLFKNKNEFVEDAINTFLMARKDIRISIAIELYKEGNISLGRMAEIADISYEEAKEILSKKGIEIRRGSRNVLELNRGAKKLLEILE